MPPEENSSLKQIRTFQGDVADALKKQQESLVSIQRAEQIKRGSFGSTTNVGSSGKTGKEYTMLVLGSLVLFGLAGGIVWLAYTQFTGQKITPPNLAPTNQFLSINSEVDVNVGANTSRQSLITLIYEKASGIGAGELKHLVLRKSAEINKPLLETDEFLDILDVGAPSPLIRAFDPLFMYGALGESRFLLIKLVSFENAFAGMLTWEKSLPQDLGPLFRTAPQVTNLPPGQTFVDITDRNKDIRALLIAGEPVLLYTFFDNNMLVITDDIATLRTLIERLTREKLSR